MTKIWVITEELFNVSIPVKAFRVEEAAFDEVEKRQEAEADTYFHIHEIELED